MAPFPNFTQREPSAAADSMFIERWSPRAFEKVDINEEVMTRIMDAARWSPSCFNDQPWRIVTSTQSSFARFLDCLVQANQAWAKHSSVLGFLVAQKNFSRNGKPNNFAQFDCGAAWMSLSLQARLEGLYTHGMGGVDFDAAANLLNIDNETQQVVMGFAIGKLASYDVLNDDQKAAEVPNQRLDLNEIWSTV